MTSWGIVGLLAGVPLGIMVLLALLTLGPHVHRTPRYRPGQEWPYPPVWWTADPPAWQHPVPGQHTGSGPDARTGGPRGGCRGDW